MLNAWAKIIGNLKEKVYPLLFTCHHCGATIFKYLPRSVIAINKVVSLLKHFVTMQYFFLFLGEHKILNRYNQLLKMIHSDILVIFRHKTCHLFLTFYVGDCVCISKNLHLYKMLSHKEMSFKFKGLLTPSCI
jgi:hypothetical protein